MLGTFAVACVIFSFSVTVRVDRASDSSSFASPVDGARASSAIASAVASSRVSVLAIRVHTNDDASEHVIDVARVELSLHRAPRPPSSRRRASPLPTPRAFSRAAPTVFLVTDHDSSRHPLDQSHHGIPTMSNHITRTHHIARLDQSHRVESDPGDARRGWARGRGRGRGR